MTFGPEAHRQNVIRKVSGFVPHRRQRHMTADQVFVRERLDPGEAIRVRPYRVVNAREINIEFAAPIFQKVWQEKRHLVH